MSAARIACRTDKSTLASIDAFEFKHLALDLSVDFDAHKLVGTAAWSVVITKQGATELVLDTSSGLVVSEASVNGVKVEHTWKPKHEAFGTPLAVPLPAELRETGRELRVVLSYQTSPDSSALQWLPPAQTAGKERPYMFSQCQAIHARALLPCPDAPTAKFTYEANVLVPQWATALMSAVSRGEPQSSGADARTFGFEQTVPVPSYLVAIAVGELRGVSVGPRSTVWAEPSVVDAAAWEFAEAESFIAAGEDLLGVPYIWTRYDILCMPPSFPYGGMENPCLTFATPTLLAGDRSLANVICHEVAHSWTGNLVTNHTWEHFWLNEGWTRWVENRIAARLVGGDEGEALYDFSMQESLTHLEDAILTFGKDSPLTALVPPLDGIDPDDAFSAVPYEKGLALLNFLTTVVGGRPAFEDFAKAYIGHFQRRTLTSQEFKAFFLSWCEAREIDGSAVDWEAWLTTPGMPVVSATYPDPLGAAGTRLAERWLAELSHADTFAAEEYTAMDTKIKIHFLETLLSRSLAAAAPPMSVAALEKMDALYGLTASKNAELRVRWQRLCIRHRAAFIVPHALQFVLEVGRMKFVRPIYRELGEWSEHREQTVETFKANRSMYHPIAAKVIANNDLKLSD